MLGGGCFVFYNQNFPCISQSSCISSNKNRISKVLAGIVKAHCLLQDSAAKLLMKSEFWFWLCQPPDLCSMHSLDQSSTNQTITCPNSPKPWPATTPAQEPARRNQDSLGGGAEREVTDIQTHKHRHTHTTCPAIIAWLMISQLNDPLFSLCLLKNCPLRLYSHV